MKKSIFYRPEIDGLRAIAVSAVIIFHAEILISNHMVLKGGFIGVDIFFVISGYLISKIIFQELESSQRFSILNFYERRARRILPTLFIVILVSFIAAWLFLLPDDYTEYAKSVLSSLFFYSNFFFYKVTTSYGADSSLLKPLLHTWSLSVEEQFYLFFPVIFILIHKFSTRYAFPIIIVLILGSLQLADFLSIKHSQLNFYLLPTRIWELSAGTLLALIELKYGRQFPKITHHAFPIFGLCLIAYAVLFFNKSTPHPSFYTVIPVLGTCLIILFSNKEELVGKILSLKPAVGIGLVSYSLYLWHFPVFAFARVSNYQLNEWDKVGCIILTVFLSVLSYIFIEQPFRNKTKIRTPRALFFMLAMFGVCVVLSTAVILNDGFKQRIPEIFQIRAENYRNLKNEKGKCEDNEAGFCEFGNEASATKIVLIGDSHMDALSADLYKRIKDKYTFVESVRSGCLFSAVQKYGDSIHGPAGICNYEPQSKIMKFFGSDEKNIVIYGGRFPMYLSQRYFDNGEGGVEGGEVYSAPLIVDKKQFIENIRRTILKIADDGQTVILVYPIPEAGWNVPKKLLADRPIGTTSEDQEEYLKKHILSTDYKLYLKRTKEAFELLDSIKHKNIYRVYPDKLFCNTDMPGRCVTHNAKHLFYADDDHPNDKGAEMINDQILRVINGIRKNKPFN